MCKSVEVVYQNIDRHEYGRPAVRICSKTESVFGIVFSCCTFYFEVCIQRFSCIQPFQPDAEREILVGFVCVCSKVRLPCIRVHVAEPIPTAYVHLQNAFRSFIRSQPRSIVHVAARRCGCRGIVGIHVGIIIAVIAHGEDITAVVEIAIGIGSFKVYGIPALFLFDGIGGRIYHPVPVYGKRKGNIAVFFVQFIGNKVYLCSRFGNFIIERKFLAADKGGKHIFAAYEFAVYHAFIHYGIRSRVSQNKSRRICNGHTVHDVSKFHIGIRFRKARRNETDRFALRCGSLFWRVIFFDRINGTDTVDIHRFVARRIGHKLTERLERVKIIEERIDGQYKVYPASAVFFRKFELVLNGRRCVLYLIPCIQFARGIGAEHEEVVTFIICFIVRRRPERAVTIIRPVGIGFQSDDAVSALKLAEPIARSGRFLLNDPEVNGVERDHIARLLRKFGNDDFVLDVLILHEDGKIVNVQFYVFSRGNCVCRKF